MWFAVPGGVDLPTGGATYDRKVIAALRAAGWHIDVLGWPATFPFPDEAARRAVAASLAALPDNALVVIDGLALGTLPALAREQAQRLRLVALVHHPLALEAGLSPEVATRFAAEEREALRHVRAVIVTSATTAATLAADFAVSPDRIAVAAPGIELRPPKSGVRAPGPLRILALGQVAPRKAHHILVAALAGVMDLDFSCVIAGDLRRSPETAAALVRQIARLGLSERVALAGTVSDAESDRLHAEADLFALASTYEGYGMALAEAMAWGLPILATTGGAIPEVVPPEAGILVPPGDITAFTETLRMLITDPARRATLAEGARNAAVRFGGWDTTAARIAQAIRSLAPA